MTEEIPQEAKDFVDRIVPNKYKEGRYVHKRGRILINDEYFTPDEILKKDPFFEDFRKSIKPNNTNNTVNIKKKVIADNNKKNKQLSKDISIDDLLMNYSD